MLELSHPAPCWNVTCAQEGGGLCIWAGGTATLTNVNVYKNQAFGSGGGLYIHEPTATLTQGTATLTDTNVYENDSNVCARLLNLP